MEELAAAAVADMTPATAEDATVPEIDPKSTIPALDESGPGMKKVKGLRNRLEQLENKHERKESQVMKLIEKSRSKALKQRELELKATYEKDAASLADTILSVQNELKEAEKAASELQALEARKEFERKENAEANRAMSDAGAVALCELVLGKHGKAFSNFSDSSEKVWQHVHADFMAMVEAQELPESDGRSAAALRTR